jgi:hypothetical protein
MKRIRFFLVLIVAVFIFSCGDNPLAPIIEQLAETADYYPMAVGNEWVYEYKDSDGDTGEYWETIVSHGNNFGKDSYVFQNDWGYKYYRYKDKTGMYIYWGATTKKHKKGKSTIIWKYPGWNKFFEIPFVQGHKWDAVIEDTEKYDEGTEWECTVYCKQNNYFETVGMEDVNVPAGKFEDCYKVKAQWDFYYKETYTYYPEYNSEFSETGCDYFWFAKDVGQVKYRFEIEDYWSEDNLKSYTIK